MQLTEPDLTNELRAAKSQLEARVVQLQKDLDDARDDARRARREHEDTTLELARVTGRVEVLQGAQPQRSIIEEIKELMPLLRGPEPPTRAELIQEIEALRTLFASDGPRGEAPAADGLASLGNVLTRTVEMIDGRMTRRDKRELLDRAIAARNGGAQRAPQQRAVGTRGPEDVDLRDILADRPEPKRAEPKRATETLAKAVIDGVRETPPVREWVRRAAPLLTRDLLGPLEAARDQESLLNLISVIPGIDVDELAELLEADRLRRGTWVASAVQELQRVVQAGRKKTR